MENNQKKRGPILFVTLIVMGILIIGLTIGLIFTFLSFQRYKAETQKTIETMVDVDTIVNEAVEQEEVIKMEVFKGYAAQYGITIEFLQRFFDNKVVYRDGTEIVYAPIDESIPKNTLDFQNGLVRVDGKLQYHEDGVSVAKKGIDISKHQGTIDWKKVKETGMVDYAIIRLGNRGYTKGNILIDDNFHKNIKGAIDAGFPVGVYFYSQSITVDEAIEEAKFVLENVKDYDLAYPVVFDAEETGDETARTHNISKELMTDMTVAFCEEIEKAGHTPMVYGNVKWMMAKIDLSKLTKYDKWFAQYFNTPFFPYELAMWQYTATGQIDGIEGNVDFNLCFKDYETKKAEQ